MANDAKNKFPIRRKLRSVYIAKHTKIFPAMDKNIKKDRNTPVEEKRTNRKWAWEKQIKKLFISLESDGKASAYCMYYNKWQKHYDW